MSWPTSHAALPLSSQFVGRAAGLLAIMEDPEVTDVLINGTLSLYVDRAGKLAPLPSPFMTPDSLFDFIERLLVPIGKRVDAAHPYLDGRLLDGSRFHLILPPVAPQGPLISIRKFRRFEPGSRLAAFGPESIVNWLREQVRKRSNILLAGGTGSGKTTLLTALLSEVNPTERLAILEESLEIRVDHPHVLHLEARPASPDGTGEVTLRTLLRNTLRMRPDRIIVGECRGEEAFEMLQAMNTGHPGSLCTIHANSGRDALRRLEGLAFLTGFALPLKTIREWVSSAVHVVVHLERRGEVRRITEIIQVHGLEGDVYRFTPHYLYAARE